MFIITAKYKKIKPLYNESVYSLFTELQGGTYEPQLRFTKLLSVVQRLAVVGTAFSRVAVVKVVRSTIVEVVVVVGVAVMLVVKMVVVLVVVGYWWWRSGGGIVEWWWRCGVVMAVV